MTTLIEQARKYKTMAYDPDYKTREKERLLAALLIEIVKRLPSKSPELEELEQIIAGSREAPLARPHPLFGINAGVDPGAAGFGNTLRAAEDVLKGR